MFAEAIEAIFRRRNGSPSPESKPQDGIELIFNEDRTLVGCTVKGVSEAEWSTITRIKFATHDSITDHLAQQGLLKPDTQHVVLSCPQTVDGKLRLGVQIENGSRPINLHQLYLSPP